MQSLLCRFDPRLTPIALPMLWPHLDQHHPGRLDEQGAQTAIAPLSCAAEDCSVSSRDLFRHQPKRRAEVAALRKRVSRSDCGHHRTRDDWPNAVYGHQPLAALSCRASASISLDRLSMRSSSQCQPTARSSMARNMRGDRASQGAARRRGNSARKKRKPCRTATPEGAGLIDEASALTDQPLTHPVQGLQIELLGRLCRDELHSRALDCLGDRLGVAEVILLSLGIWAHVPRRHQASVMSEHLAAEMMCPNTSLHADETGRQVGQSCLHLPRDHFCRSNDCTTFIAPPPRETSCRTSSR